MSELLEKQTKFVFFKAFLILHAYSLGYKMSQPDCRSKHMKNSNHYIGLAEDFNLFKEGDYLKDTEDHRQLGEYWEKLHPLCRWGGRWGDGNHYSMEHNGVK